MGFAVKDLVGKNTTIKAISNTFKVFFDEIIIARILY